MQFDKGYISPHFVTDKENMEVVLEKPYILIHEKKISAIKDLIPLLEFIINKAKRPLLIIAEDVEGEALATLVVNHLRGVVTCCAVKAPGFGDRRKAMMEDIAVMTGGKGFFDDLGISLEKFNEVDLGQAKKVIVNKDNCTIIEGAGANDAVKGRIEQIKMEISRTTSDYDKEKHQERLAKLSGGVAQIKVGAATEVEMKEKKARVEDAMHACRAAIEEGILPGGGVAPLRALAKVLDKEEKRLKGDQRTGVDIVRRALWSPIKAIAANAGVDGSVVAQKVFDNDSMNFGYNALTGEYGDMIKMGILVPTKVERIALQNAASIAGTLLTTDCLIAEIKEKNSSHPQPEMGPGY